MNVLSTQMRTIDSLTSRLPVPAPVRTVYCGLRRLKNSILNTIDPPVIVLLYHRVASLQSDPEMLAVSPENFRSHMRLIKNTCRIVRFEEDWGVLKEPAVAVTFDDGYADNFLEALPILEETGVPATFFVSTCHLGSDREFWWHRLEGILLQDGDFPVRFQLEDPQYGSGWDTVTLQQRKELYRCLNSLMQKIDDDRRDDWLEQLGTWAGMARVGEGIHRSMTQEEVKRLAASPQVTVGAHTVTHSSLSSLTEERQRHEIFASKEALERITGKEITTFSYPFGTKTHYDQTSMRLCREAGFKKAASNFPGQAHRWTDSFQIPRHLVRDWGVETFAARSRSFWA